MSTKGLNAQFAIWDIRNNIKKPIEKYISDGKACYFIKQSGFQIRVIESIYMVNQQLNDLILIRPMWYILEDICQMNIVVEFLKYQSNIYYFACDFNQNVEGFDVVHLANIQFNSLDKKKRAVIYFINDDLIGIVSRDQFGICTWNSDPTIQDIELLEKLIETAPLRASQSIINMTNNTIYVPNPYDNPDFSLNFYIDNIRQYKYSLALQTHNIQDLLED